MIFLMHVRLQIRYLQEFCLIFIRVDYLALFHHEVRVANKDELIALSVGVLHYLNIVL